LRLGCIVGSSRVPPQKQDCFPREPADDVARGSGEVGSGARRAEAGGVIGNGGGMQGKFSVAFVAGWAGRQCSPKGVVSLESGAVCAGLAKWGQRCASRAWWCQWWGVQELRVLCAVAGTAEGTGGRCTGRDRWLEVAGRAGVGGPCLAEELAEKGKGFYRAGELGGKGFKIGTC